MTLRQCLLTLATMAALAFLAGCPEVGAFLAFAFGLVLLAALPMPSSVWTNRRDARRRGAR